MLRTLAFSAFLYRCALKSFFIRRVLLKTPLGVYYRRLLAPGDNSGIYDGLSIGYSNSVGVEFFTEELRVPVIQLLSELGDWGYGFVFYPEW